jgi:hypothetical protein
MASKNARGILTMTTKIQKQTRQQRAYSLAETTGRNCREIAEDMGDVTTRTVWGWLRDELGEEESVRTFCKGVKRRKVDMLRKVFGWSYYRTAQAMGVSRQSVYNLLRHEPKGRPRLLVQVTGHIKGIRTGTYAVVKWLDKDKAGIIEQEGNLATLVVDGLVA